jgi:hypothetical protein
MAVNAWRIIEIPKHGNLSTRSQRKEHLKRNKAKKVQKKREAESNRYGQVEGEEKAKRLQKTRYARWSRYIQMPGEEKAYFVKKKTG